MTRRKWLLFIILVLPWLTQSAQRYYFRQAYVDADVNLAMAQQWLQNGQLRLPTATLAQPAAVHLTPMPDLMPGYPLALACFLSLKTDPYLALWLLDVLCIGWIWVWMVLFMKKFASPTLSDGLLVLLWGTFTLTPWRYLGGSDLAALACLLPALSFAFQSQTRVTWLSLTGMMFFSLLAYTMRYAYLPFVVVLPVWVSWQQVRKKSYRQALAPALSALLALAGLYAWIMWQKMSGTGTYLYESEQLLYPLHLLMADPFPVKAWVYAGIPHLLAASKYLSVSWRLLHQIGWIPALAMIVLAAQWAWKNRENVPDDLKKWASLWATVTVIICGMLAALSLTHAPQDWNWVGFWTFVMETRYYAPLLIGIELLGFVLVLGLKSKYSRLFWLGSWAALAMFQGGISWMLVLGNAPSTGDWRRHEGPEVWQRSLQVQSQSALPVVFTDLDGGWGPAVAGIPAISADGWLARKPGSFQTPLTLIVLHSEKPGKADSTILAQWKPFRVQGPDTLRSGRVWEVLDWPLKGKQ